MTEKPQYAPPPYPPPQKPLIHPSSAPYSIDLELLAHQGWLSLPITFSEDDPLFKPFSELFACSAQFFSLPEEQKAKYKVASRAAYTASEEGYSNIPGEKSMITLRRVETTPTEFEVRARAEAAWRASAVFMRGVLTAIEESLGMTPGVLVRTMGPKIELLPKEGEGTVATLLRMFRYERPRPDPTSEAPLESRVVAEAHKDLGLLSLVVGHTPGLECWDPVANEWASCETGGEPGQLKASILVGQTLAKFTNWRYTAGRHRVFVHPLSTSVNISTSQPSSESKSESETDSAALLSDPSYRFSLVHALRAHLPVRVSSSDFETALTGPFAPHTQFSDVPISDIYHAISNAHWNVNIGLEERRRQELEIKERLAGEAQNPPAPEKTQDMQVIPPNGSEATTRANEKDEASNKKGLVLGGFKSLFKRSST